ncbi:hypothetical protein [Humibacillus sp. DSM 29435]|uniref:hypothetical protein n=1 Tax=Humibacillus sp. DSM 29435 TaxID=1869167 RepID=UPI001C2F9F7D|nr:hypothetical protein [Humibacillus sp. DSM 29435]
MNERIDRFAESEPKADPVGTKAAAVVHNETYNPWSVVSLVFEHLVDQGLHPVLGESGDPGAPARELLAALGIEPRAEGNREVMKRVHAQLDELRAAVFETP